MQYHAPVIRLLPDRFSFKPHRILKRSHEECANLSSQGLKHHSITFEDQVPFEALEDSKV
jgi:hypothetical protein